MSKIKQLFNFGLAGGSYGIGTMQEIEEMCSDFNTTIANLSSASYDEVMDFVCEGWDVDQGYYQVTDGIIEVCGEEEDYEIVLISNLRIVS